MLGFGRVVSIADFGIVDLDESIGSAALIIAVPAGLGMYAWAELDFRWRLEVDSASLSVRRLDAA
jgi:hypothetical protein